MSTRPDATAGTSQIERQSFSVSVTRYMSTTRPETNEPMNMPDAERDERDEALRGGADARRRRLLVDVDLAGHEEEVVTDAVQQDADVQHPHERAGVAEREQHVPHRPGEHADEQHPLDAEPHEEQRHDAA